MNYVVITKEWMAARSILPLPTMRKSKDGTKYLAHEDFFNAFKKPEKESTEEQDTPVLEDLKLYPHNSTELNELLNSEEWNYESEETNSADYIQIVSVSNLMETTKSNIQNYNISNKEINNLTNMLPLWEDLIGTPLPFKYKLQYNGKAYRTNQAHTPQLDWKPDEVKSLYGLISNHDGTLEDQIPYEHWMIVEKGLYYTENNVLYQGLLDAPNGYDADLSSLPTIAKKIEQ